MRKLQVNIHNSQLKDIVEKKKSPYKYHSSVDEFLMQISEKSKTIKDFEDVILRKLIPICEAQIYIATAVIDGELNEIENLSMYENGIQKLLLMEVFDTEDLQDIENEVKLMSRLGGN